MLSETINCEYCISSCPRHACRKKQVNGGKQGGEGMTELKPCPFCKAKAKAESYLEIYWVSCRKRSCKVKPQTDCYKTQKGALKAWNRRAGK